MRIIDATVMNSDGPEDELFPPPAHTAGPVSLPPPPPPPPAGGPPVPPPSRRRRGVALIAAVVIASAVVGAALTRAAEGSKSSTITGTRPVPASTAPPGVDGPVTALDRAVARLRRPHRLRRPRRARRCPPLPPRLRPRSTPTPSWPRWTPPSSTSTPSSMAVKPPAQAWCSRRPASSSPTTM